MSQLVPLGSFCKDSRWGYQLVRLTTEVSCCPWALASIWLDTASHFFPSGPKDGWVKSSGNCKQKRIYKSVFHLKLPLWTFGTGLRQRKSCYHQWPERNLTEQWEVCIQGCTRHFGLPWLRQESWEWLRGKTLNVSQKCSCTRRSALKKTLPPECKERAEVQTSQAGVVSKMTSCK